MMAAAFQTLPPVSLCFKGGVTHFRQLVTEPQFERNVLLSSLRNVLSS
jgi:hypothetical protein